MNRTEGVKNKWGKVRDRGGGVEAGIPVEQAFERGQTGGDKKRYRGEQEGILPNMGPPCLSPSSENQIKRKTQRAREGENTS